MRAFLLIAAFLAGQALAEDQRQLALLPPAAQESLREEMLGNLLAINEILTLMAAGKIKEAGLLAEASLGQSAQGKHREKPFSARPGPHMPPAMHSIGNDGHVAASEFAKAASSGDREKALALLPKLTEGCVACHYSYRTR
ncbi:MAG: cytochrome C [Rhodocyclales bacterium]|nr:cytochrome C [Rhodocyclales bacterium]